MSWARLLATGSGQVAWRISIDGYPHEAVSAKSLERTTADGRKRYIGLRMDGLRLSESIDLPYAKWRAEGFTVTIADIGKRWTGTFGRQPQQITWLDASTSLSASATTVTVQSTSGFDSSGQIYCDTETIGYTGTTSTTFTTCTRGVWGSVAQYHYNTVGADLRFPEVTDWPRSIEGRRVRLFAYGAGDDHTGNGTQVWVGVAEGEPRFNGVEWELDVGPPSSVFDTDIGTELEAPRTIRGIYYPYTAPLYLRINERTSGNFATALTAETEIGLAGFWETQEEFCSDLTDLIATAIGNPISGTFVTPGANLRAEPDGESWRFVLTTPSSDARWVNVLGAPSGPISAVDGSLGPGQPRWAAGDGSLPETLSTDSTYFLRPDSATGPDSAGTVPRSTVGYFDATYGAALGSPNQSGVDSATSPNGRLYLDGPATGSTSAITLDWSANGIGIESSATVDTDTPDSTDNFVDIDEHAQWWLPDGTSDDLLVATSANLPKIGLVRSLGTGSLADLLTTLVTQTAQYLNAGTAPFIRPTDDEYKSDVDVTSDGLAELRAAADHSAYTSQRRYTIAKSVTLSELIEHEARLVGVFPCLNSNGQIVFRRLRLPSPSEASSGSLTSSVIVVDDTLLSHERSPWGSFNTVEISTGYDPIEDDYVGETYKIRDVAAYGMTPKPRVLEISPKSADGVVPTVEDARYIASSVLGVFGAPYDVLTVQVPPTLFETLLGDVVSVTWGKVPASDGTLGVSGKLGLVIGRELRPTEASGSLTILLTDQRVGGYVPAAKITSISGTSGGTGTFTIIVSADYFRSDQTAADHFKVGERIRLFRWGSTSTTTVTGTVTAIGLNAMQLTTDTGWTYGANTWAIAGAVSTDISAAHQKTYVYHASSAGRVTWDDSDTDPAFTFAP